MQVSLLDGKKKVAVGESLEEAIWALKRDRPDDFIYPVLKALGSSEYKAVDVRTGGDHMTVIRLTVKTEAE